VEREPEEMMKYWEGIYKGKVNNMEEEWHEIKKNEYVHDNAEVKYKVVMDNMEESVAYPMEMEENVVVRHVSEGGLGQEQENNRGRMVFERREIEILEIVKEHFDAVGRIESRRFRDGERMNKTVFNPEELRKKLKDLKNKKQPGPDMLKVEFFKWMLDSRVWVEEVCGAFEKILEDGEVPVSWKESKTVMIPKEAKPTPKQHRPIALTNVGYKLFMGIIKDRIVEHMRKTGEMQDFQAGFRKGRRRESVCAKILY